MKLLKKPTVANELNLQHKMRVDEGVAIATKVDALRKTLSELEVQHQNFIISKQKELNTVISSLEREIKELKAEIVTLEEKRVDLLRPLDAEWSELKSKEIDLQQKEEELRHLFLGLTQSEKEIATRERDLETKEIIITETTLKANSNLLKSEEKLAFAEGKSKESTENITKAEKIIQDKVQELLLREASISSKEREIEIIKSNLAKEEHNINKQKILLADREATLEREIKRQQKNK